VDVEKLVSEAVGHLSSSDASLPDIRNLIDRVVISHATIRIRHRELVETDVWERIKIPEPATPHDELERPFTDEEVRKLLAGPASPPMHDLMMIATLTGARLEAIVDRARDSEAGLFTFKPQKKEKSARGVPIHSALVDLVARSPSGPRRNANAPSAPPTNSPNIAAQWA
jgi:hypothetical protein